MVSWNLAVFIITLLSLFLTFYTHRISTRHSSGTVYRFIEYILYTQFLVTFYTHRISTRHTSGAV
jgi:hypothetical protein